METGNEETRNFLDRPGVKPGRKGGNGCGNNPEPVIRLELWSRYLSSALHTYFALAQFIRP